MNILPLEIFRKIIVMLPISHFVYMNQTCRMINNMKMNKLLFGWYLHLVPGEILFNLDSIIKYNKISKQKGVLYCIYELLHTLSYAIGDNTIWEKIEMNHHDYVLRLVNNSFVLPYDHLYKNDVKKRVLKEYGYFRGKCILKYPNVYALIL